MADEIVVKVEGEESTKETVEQTLDVVLDAAKDIADAIVEAKEEGDQNAETVQAVAITLDFLAARIGELFAEIAVVKDLVMGVSDQIAGLEALEVAEIIETETEATVDAIAETTEEVLPVVEEVTAVSEPQVRAERKSRWIK